MYILFAGLLAVFIYTLQYEYYRRNWYKNLKIDAFFKVDEAFAGDEAELTETIENAKWLPLPMIKMKLQLSRKLLFRDTDNSKVSDYFYRTDIYNIQSNQRVKRTIRFVCKERGYYDFHGVDILGTDVFYSTEFIRSLEMSSHLYVYPRPYDREVMEPVLNRINGEVITKNNLIDDPFELKGIREYQTFDSLKNVNWKASAKSEDLMVNMHDFTAKRTIRIFLDFDNATIFDREELKELCISMAVSLVIRFCKQGIPVSIYANSKDVLTDKPLEIEEGSGENHIRAVNRAFARVDFEKGTTDFFDLYKNVLLEEANDTYTIIISHYMKEDLQELLLDLKGREKDFVWLCPAYKNSQFEIHEGLKDKSILIPAEEALYEVSLS